MTSFWSHKQPSAPAQAESEGCSPAGLAGAEGGGQYVGKCPLAQLPLALQGFHQPSTGTFPGHFLLLHIRLQEFPACCHPEQ